jgi:hypothetical protein
MAGAASAAQNSRCGSFGRFRRPRAYVLLAWSHACCHNAFVATGICSCMTPRLK